MSVDGAEISTAPIVHNSTKRRLILTRNHEASLCVYSAPIHPLTVSLRRDKAVKELHCKNERAKYLSAVEGACA